jgi:hypothetical protein
MILLHRVVSLIHREGRRRQGLSTEANVMGRVKALVGADAWVREYREKLCDLILPRPGDGQIHAV